jgi:hypothetical protein
MLWQSSSGFAPRTDFSSSRRNQSFDGPQCDRDCIAVEIPTQNAISKDHQLLLINIQFVFSVVAIVQAMQSLASKATGSVSVLRMRLPTQKVVHIDETGWWVGGDSKCQHVFSTENILMFQVTDRSNQTAFKFLANASRIRSAAMGSGIRSSRNGTLQRTPIASHSRFDGTTL